MKTYRFFYHYYRQYKCLSVHFKGQCYKANDVVCNVHTESKWNKRQPNLVIQGFAKEVVIKDGVATVN